jgi:hypothetical protein
MPYAYPSGDITYEQNADRECSLKTELVRTASNSLPELLLITDPKLKSQAVGYHLNGKSDSNNVSRRSVHHVK